ncbi:hypothetical protein ACJRO7_019773 [Eucalyptus globulus]|uniref:Uncharacterized protein n=1 Tax=Eucalyptus globulus TaxID=34317 RepID=A0ABD3KGK0_EUCGL
MVPLSTTVRWLPESSVLCRRLQWPNLGKSGHHDHSVVIAPHSDDDDDRAHRRGSLDLWLVVDPPAMTLQPNSFSVAVVRVVRVATEMAITKAAVDFDPIRE